MQTKEDKFKRIIEENNGRIQSICHYYAPTPDDQKDMYQEILINVWKSLDSFRGESEIGTWIYRVAINTSLSYAGKSYKQMRLNVDINSVSAQNILIDDNINNLHHEQLNLLQTELNQLCVIDKALMGLVLQELSTKEIADVLGITEPNVRVKIHRVKELLKEKMKGGSYE
ncbi:MAG TPA: sigma-70 family RNA polymerase sigma factor [Tenuifilaceae bacterium]|nr:sigma-70 family RNA polymerase sigma factor [Tenuifilaceae bacterium]HPE19164.1 sigma-70 family RNA polymerase sigma factor [Tenuifilaceae bacterium]HPJ45513.1 sigma-70 family RNA polymerase sigma factor [Tenuifilaceae bacterium]HPQ33833.1 sigma-70 family RNA polymerase sigma factor [Tenuifilaceae bacterium]HRX68202.1 sigma-70 family RNA polymerase sigma factor [Tenuifilaceae bacterium]